MLFNIANELNYDYISKKLKLTWHDLDYGIKKKIINPSVAVDQALSKLEEKDFQIEENPYGQALCKLGWVYKYESIEPYLTTLVNLEQANNEEGSKEKWLYLVLDWVYHHKDLYKDPLDIVELIYSDFDYPKHIACFVKYMPSTGPDLGSKKLNEARLYRKWQHYLEKQSIRFLK